MSDQQLTEEWHKPIIRKSKRKVKSPFIGNIWDTDLSDMQLIIKFKKGFSFLVLADVKPADVKQSTYTDSSKEINDKDPKLKIGDFVRISKYKHFFADGCVSNWSEEVFVIKKVKNAIHVISDLKSEGIIGTFYEKQLWKTIQKEFRAEKVIKRKGDKLYVKCKEYDSSFNSRIDKKDTV